MEWKLFDDSQDPNVPPAQSTFEFHEHRERAPHLEQGVHRGRLFKTADFVAFAAATYDLQRVVDLGCGDGGLLAILKKEAPHLNAWGYDFAPANVTGWIERGVTAAFLDFVNDPNAIQWSHDITVMTEVLEHMHKPHEWVQRVAQHTKVLVASSPYTEHSGSHDGCHVWAWDQDGYRVLLEQAGFTVIRHETTEIFQVILGVVQ